MQKQNISFIRAATNLSLLARSWVKEAYSPYVKTSSSSPSKKPEKNPNICSQVNFRKEQALPNSSFYSYHTFAHGPRKKYIIGL